MKFHKQLFLHDPANGVFGDCYRTVLACLLDLPSPEDVPHYGAIHPEDGYAFEEAFNLWLKVKHKLRLVNHYLPSSFNLESALKWEGNINPGVLCIFSGMSPRGVNHSVIAHDGRMLHDPHPSNAGLIGPCDNGYWGIQYLIPEMFCYEHISEVVGN